MHVNLWKRAKADASYFGEFFRIIFNFFWHHQTPGRIEKDRLAEKYQMMDGKRH